MPSTYPIEAEPVMAESNCQRVKNPTTPSTKSQGKEPKMTSGYRVVNGWEGPHRHPPGIWRAGSLLTSILVAPERLISCTVGESCGGGRMLPVLLGYSWCQG